MEVKLTITIPIYNSELTLEKCLNSIPKRKDVEIICTDDSSTDNSLSILKEWSDKNKNNFYNIKIIENNENLGVGKTKRYMYDIAKGEYIITIDSDDWVITDNYSKAIDLLYKKYKDNELITLDYEMNDCIIRRTSVATATWRYFIKNKYLKDNNLHIHERRRAEDWFMLEDARKLDINKRPIIKRINIFAYHYNSPRVGSIEYMNKRRLDGK